MFVCIMYIYMYVCMFVCMCVHVCMYVFSVYMHVFVVCLYVCIYICMYMILWNYVCVCMYKNACMYVCVYVLGLVSLTVTIITQSSGYKECYGPKARSPMRAREASATFYITPYRIRDGPETDTRRIRDGTRIHDAKLSQ